MTGQDESTKIWPPAILKLQNALTEKPCFALYQLYIELKIRSLSTRPSNVLTLHNVFNSSQNSNVDNILPDLDTNRISLNNVPPWIVSPFLKKLNTYIKKEHYSNVCTFEIASLVNVTGYYLRKYGISNG